LLNSLFDQKVLEQRIVEALLRQSRRCRTKGEYAQAERICKKALDRAEAVTGKSSPLTGLVLMELFELYDNQTREDESEAVWKRIRQILLSAKFCNWHGPNE
jgi:hypothetical protein